MDLKLFLSSLSKSESCCMFAHRMSFSEFQRQYSRIEICTLTPDAITSDQVKPWSVKNYSGNWRRGSTAGGCRNHARKHNFSSFDRFSTDLLDRI